MLSIIVACAKNNVIGKSNELPWYLPADLAYFKQKTTNQSVIMGRNTFDSILARLHSPLPNRQNIVLSRMLTTEYDVQVAGSIDEAIKLATSDEVFVMGGAQVYKQAIELADRLYITEVEADIDGDTFFPSVDKSLFREVSRESHQKNEKNPYNYSFVVYERV